VIGIEAPVEIDTNVEMTVVVLVLGMIEIDVDHAVVAHIVVIEAAMTVGKEVDTVAAIVIEIDETEALVLVTNLMTTKGVVNEMTNVDKTGTEIVHETALMIEATERDRVHGNMIADVKQCAATTIVDHLGDRSLNYFCLISDKLPTQNPQTALEAMTRILLYNKKLNYTQ
jgi:hypothetical protein